MELTAKKELILKLFCLLIIIILNILIYLNGVNLSCKDCYVNFESFRTPTEDASYKIFQKLNVSIARLYESYVNDECVITFDSNQGYYLKGDFKNALPIK